LSVSSVAVTSSSTSRIAAHGDTVTSHADVGRRARDSDYTHSDENTVTSGVTMVTHDSDSDGVANLQRDNTAHDTTRHDTRRHDTTALTSHAG
jgi:hypothetical protein